MEATLEFSPRKRVSRPLIYDYNDVIANSGQCQEMVRLDVHDSW